jgi:hypothetical protein
MRILPRRGQTYQPRATPWDWKFNRHQALKGRDTGTAMLRPFRAQVSTSDPIPGRCPGLICGYPFGATGNDAGIDATVSSLSRICPHALRPFLRRVQIGHDFFAVKSPGPPGPHDACRHRRGSPGMRDGARRLRTGSPPSRSPATAGVQAAFSSAWSPADRSALCPPPAPP